MMIKKINIIKYGKKFLKLFKKLKKFFKKLHEKTVLSDSDIPADEIIKISSVTIVIKSLIEKDNTFYLELALNHCLHEI